jgi:hypothetical protein
MYYMGFTWESFYPRCMTVEERKWFIKRMNEEVERNKGNGVPTKDPSSYTPELKQLTGNYKPFSPNARSARLS